MLYLFVKSSKSILFCSPFDFKRVLLLFSLRLVFFDFISSRARSSRDSGKTKISRTLHIYAHTRRTLNCRPEKSFTRRTSCISKLHVFYSTHSLSLSVFFFFSRIVLHFCKLSTRMQTKKARVATISKSSSSSSSSSSTFFFCLFVVA